MAVAPTKIQLVETLCARAGAAQFRSRVTTNTVVGPGDAQAPVAFLFDFTRLNRRSSPFSCFNHLLTRQLTNILVSYLCRLVVYLLSFAFRLTHRFGYRIGRDSKVRRIPDHLPIAQDDYLRRLVHHTQSVLNFR